MKKPFYLSCIAALGLATVGCGGDDDGTLPACVNPDANTIFCNITEDTTWTAGTYTLAARVYIEEGAVLTIEPGTEIRGNLGAALIATRGTQIQAVGTEAEPIVFTCPPNVDGRVTGCWAGVALLGEATVNDGTCVGGTGDDCTGGYFEQQLEGIESTDPRAIYGGSDDASSCGHLEYVRIEFAGSELSPGNELNGLTVAGCGEGTTLSYVQVHRGKDDGIEFFGGTAGMDHVVISGSTDDGLDWDEGWRGDVQFLVIQQMTGLGDNAIEADNLGSRVDADPRSLPNIWNATLCGVSGDGKRGVRHREGTGALVSNAIVQDFTGEAMDVNDDATVALWDTDLLWTNTFYWSNTDPAAVDPTASSFSSDNTVAFDLAASVAAEATNVFDADPGVDCNDTAPDYVPTNVALEGQAAPPAGFDTTATYAGAFEPNGTDWTAGWTSFPED